MAVYKAREVVRRGRMPRHASDRSRVFVRSFTLRPDTMVARDTDELKIAAKIYVRMAASNTLNETRFIIDLDETTARISRFPVYTWTSTRVRRCVCVCVQIMALPVCGLYRSSITCLRWLIDCLDYAPFSCYNMEHRIRIASFRDARSLARSLLRNEFILSLISTRIPPAGDQKPIKPRSR